MPSITLKNISKYVCQAVDLDIVDKELLVLLGPNGAGKTTLVNIIAGLTDYSGSVFFDSVPMDKLVRTWSRSRRKKGFGISQVSHSRILKRWHNQKKERVGGACNIR